MDPPQHIHLTRNLHVPNPTPQDSASPIQQQPTPPANIAPPPPYTSHEDDNATDTDIEDRDEDDGFSAFAADFNHNNTNPPSSHPILSRPAATSATSPLKLTINAANRIHGSQNLVPMSPSALADATRFSAVLLAAVKQLNHAATSASTADAFADGAKASTNLNVSLTINCGITVIGDRNVVGNVGLRPKPVAPKTAVATASVDAGAGAEVAKRESSVEDGEVVVGAKRKAEDEEDVTVSRTEGSGRVKRINIDQDSSE